jgi:hypothetical protein
MFTKYEFLIFNITNINWHFPLTHSHRNSSSCNSESDTLLSLSAIMRPRYLDSIVISWWFGRNIFVDFAAKRSVDMGKQCDRSTWHRFSQFFLPILCDSLFRSFWWVIHEDIIIFAIYCVIVTFILSGADNDTKRHPTRISLPVEIIQLSVSETHTCALGTKNECKGDRCIWK